ncbi:hypothetical protein KRR40_07455 [Niabella defluvii]|nr:hypothetical protein KRR40_07455 [Niabella sp. I65]
MNAFNNEPLTKDELEKDCLCYMTYEGGTVKSSRLFAGYAHEQVIKNYQGILLKCLITLKKSPMIKAF